MQSTPGNSMRSTKKAKAVNEVATVIMHAELQYFANAILQLSYNRKNVIMLEKLTSEALIIINSLEMDDNAKRTVKILNEELEELQRIRNYTRENKQDSLLIACFITLKISMHNYIYKTISD